MTIFLKTRLKVFFFIQKKHKNHHSGQNICYKRVGGTMQIIIKLKEVRERYNISLRELAKLTGISKSHLNYIEKGEREPSLSTIIRIAVALNIDEKELYEVKR